jgi:hypothetical protein
LAVPIESPALSMFCISTPDEFFAALSEENVSGGLINRFLVIESNDGIEQHQWKELNVPRELVEKLKLLRNGGYQLGAVGNECGCLWDSEKKSYSPQGPMPPLVKLLWADEDAVMSWAIFKENMKARRAEDPTLDIYLKRTAEYAVRLATIRAVARAGSWDTSVDISDLPFGIQWACPAAEQLARWAQERMNHDDHKFSDQWKKIVELVTSFQSKNGGAAMPHSICLNKSRYTAKVFKEVVGTLDENLTLEIVNNYEFQGKVMQKGGFIATHRMGTGSRNFPGAARCLRRSVGRRKSAECTNGFGGKAGAQSAFPPPRPGAEPRPVKGATVAGKDKGTKTIWTHSEGGLPPVNAAASDYPELSVARSRRRAAEITSYHVLQHAPCPPPRHACAREWHVRLPYERGAQPSHDGLSRGVWRLRYGASRPRHGVRMLWCDAPQPSSTSDFLLG